MSASGGGPDKTILVSARPLADSSHYRPMAAYLHPPNDPGFEVLRHRAAAAACPLIGIPDRGPIDFKGLGLLLRVCRQLGVRIWHAHDYKSNLVGLLLRPFHSMKLVTTVHGWVSPGLRMRLYYSVDRLCLPRYDHVICVSDDLFARAQKLGVARQRCTLIRNAVDESVYHRQLSPKESALRARYGVPPDRLVLGAVGRLSPEKGFDTLLRAVAGLSPDRPDFEVWIAGEGSSRPALQSLIVSFGLADRVRLLGYWDDPVELFHAFDAFVLSSRREGLPNVLLEALAMEVPVIATRVGGVPTVVSDAESAVLCPAGDEDALGAAIIRVLADRALQQRLARAGRQLVEREFSLRSRVAAERAVYDRVLEGT